jgi:hypothetical protein
MFKDFVEVPWVECPVMTLDMSLPVARRFANVPPAAFGQGKKLLNAVMREVPPVGRMLADLARIRTMNRFQQEAVSLATQVNATWREVMIANLSYDLVLNFMGCSTVVLPTPSGPVIARNMDWWPEDILAQASYQVRFMRGEDLLFVNAGWPGAIGVVSGLSGRGFAVVLNAVKGPEKGSRTGYPVLLHLRRVLEDARNFDDALRMLTDQHLASSALFTLAGTENAQRVVIERSPRRHAQRWPEGDRCLVATNDYRLLFKPETHEGLEIYQTTCYRYQTLTDFFARHQPGQEVEDAALLYILSDVNVRQSITAQHVLLRPRSRTVKMFVPRHLIDPTPGNL